jgi:hypothetical protein
MKKIILVMGLLFMTVFSFAQVRTLAGFEPSTGRPGYKLNDTLRNLYATSPAYFLNDSTIGVDTSRMSFTVAKNATRDSVIYSFFDGTRVAIKDSTGGGTSDTTFLRLTANNLGVTRDYTKGLALMNYTAATSGNQQISPQLIFTGNSYAATPAASRPVDVIMDILPVQGSTIGLGYLRFGHRVNGGAVSENILTIGTSSDGTARVGIGQVPYGTAGQILNIAGGIQMTGNITVGTFSMNSFGSNFIDFSSNIFRLASGTGYQALSTDKPVSLGKLTEPAFGAALDISSTVRAFLPPRMTTTQRDSINLTVTSVTITNAGTGYATAPTLAFTAGPAPTAGAINTAQATCTVSAGAINTVTVSPSFVGHYNSTPTITVTGGGGTGAILTPVMTQVLTAGMLIYNTTTNKMQCWNGSTWNDLF